MFGRRLKIRIAVRDGRLMLADIRIPLRNCVMLLVGVGAAPFCLMKRLFGISSISTLKGGTNCWRRGASCMILITTQWVLNSFSCWRQEKGSSCMRLRGLSTYHSEDLTVILRCFISDLKHLTDIRVYLLCLYSVVIVLEHVNQVWIRLKLPSPVIRAHWLLVSRDALDPLLSTWFQKLLEAYPLHGAVFGHVDLSARSLNVDSPVSYSWRLYRLSRYLQKSAIFMARRLLCWLILNCRLVQGLLF